MDRACAAATIRVSAASTAGPRGSTAPPFGQRDRQVRGADEHAVDARHGENVVHRRQRLAGLDHGDGERDRVGLVQIGGAGETAQRRRTRADPRSAAPAAGTSSRRRRRCASATLLIIGAITPPRPRPPCGSRRRNRRRRSAPRWACPPARPTGSPRAAPTRSTRAVLHVERHRVEILARQRLGDLGIVDADPGAVDAAGAQALRQLADHRLGHVSSRCRVGPTRLWPLRSMAQAGRVSGGGNG